jgi:hypothetical protein
MAIAATEAKSAAERASNLDERIELAMKAVKNHWLVTNDSERFQSAVAAVYALSNEEEQDRIKADLEALKVINAVISGVPVDIDRVEPPEKPLGLGRRWLKVNAD